MIKQKVTFSLVNKGVHLRAKLAVLVGEDTDIGGYVVYVPFFRQCGQGETYEEAKQGARDFIFMLFQRYSEDMPLDEFISRFKIEEEVDPEKLKLSYENEQDEEESESLKNLKVDSVIVDDLLLEI